MADLAPGAEEIQKLGDAGFSADEINTYRQQTTDRLLKGGFKPQEIQSYWGQTPPDDSKLKSYVQGNASVLSADDKAKIAQNPIEVFRAGLQHGATSLLEGPPELKAPPDMGIGGRILYGAGQMINELPEMAAGFIGGTAAGTAVGGAVTAPLGGVGAVPGGVIGGGAGANALPTAMREILTDYYSHKGGPAPTWDQVWQRASAITIDTLKAGGVGAASNVAGGVAGRVVEAAGGGAVAQGVGNIMAQTAAATTTGAALEGHVPQLNDFITGAALAVGMWGTGATAGRFVGAQSRYIPSNDTIDVATNLRDIYVKTGLNPKDIIENAQKDPALQSEVLAPRDSQGHVVTPGLKQLAPPEPPPYKTEPQIQPPEPHRPDIAFGDSIAVGTIRHAGMFGSEADFTTGQDQPGTARIGAPTTEVLRRISDTPDDQVRGKDVLLSTGISNSPGRLDVIPEQIQKLKDKGARSISILGVGTNSKLAGINDHLQQIADQSGGSVHFIGPLKHVASDGIHSTNYRDEIQGVVGQHMAATGGPGTPSSPGATTTPPQGEQAPTQPPVTVGTTHPAEAVDLSKYATGNAVPGGPSSVVGVHPEFAQRIETMVEAMPANIRSKFQIISGVRSHEREVQVYQEQHPGQSIPEDSYHSHGMAVDTTWDPEVRQWIRENGGKYGVGYTLADTQPGEGNHLEPTENGQRIPHGQLADWARNHSRGGAAPTTGVSPKPGTLVATTPESVTDEHLTLFRTLEGNRDGHADHAVSPSGAVGRNQIMPDTAKQYGFDPSKLQDPDYNDNVAKHIISDLSVKFNGNLADMLVAYNAGPGRARMWIEGGRKMSDLPIETQHYLEHAERLGALNEGYNWRAGDMVLRHQGDGGAWVPPDGQPPPPILPPPPGSGTGEGPLALPAPERGPFPLNEDMMIDKTLDIVGSREERSVLDWLNPRKIISSFQAQLTPARRLDTRMGITPEQIGAEDMLRQTYGAAGRAEHFIRWGILDPMTFRQTNDASIVNAFHAVKSDGGTSRGFIAYLLNKRAVEKSDQGIDTGVDLENARQFLSLKGVEDKYGRAAQIWGQVTDGIVDYARDSGVFSEAQATAMKSANRSYLTMRRIMDPEYQPPRPPGRNFGVRSPTKKMTGSDRTIDDPLTATIDNIHTMVAMADRNRAVGHIINEANQNLPPEDALFTQVKVYTPEPRRPSNWDVRDENGKPLHTEWFTKDENGNYVPMSPDSDEAVNLLDTYRQSGRRTLGPNDFVYFNQGRMEIWHTKDPDLAAAMRMPWPGQSNPITNIAIKMAGLQRAGITSQLSFPFRALWHGQIASTVMAREAQTYPYHDVMRGILSAFRSGGIGLDSGYRRWVANGGADSALSSIDQNYVQRDIDHIFAETNNHGSVWNFFRHPIEQLRAFQHMMDAVPRLGYFLRSEAEGTDPFKAALNSRTAYLDHAEPLAASWAQTFSRMVPFFSVAWKDMQQLTRAIRERPVGTLTKGAMWLTAPTILNYAVNYLVDQTLPQKDRYSELPQWERDMYWVLPPVNGYRMRIPRPYNAGWYFATMPEHFLDYMRNDSVDQASKFFESFVRQVLPPFVPTLAYPVGEAAFNYDFYTNRPLIKQSLEKASAYMSYTPDTTLTAKGIGKLIGAEAPVSTLVGRLPLANATVTDEFLNQWAGPAPYYMMRLLEAPWRSDQKPWQVSDLPFVGAFFARQPAGYGSQSIEDFFTRFDQFEASHTDLQMALKHANPAEVHQSQMVEAGLRLTKMKTALTGIAQTLQGIDGNEKMTADEKRKYSDLLTGQMVSIAHTGLTIMQRVDAASHR